MPIGDRRCNFTSRGGPGCHVKHTSMRLLFDYWNRQRGERSAPARSEIDPGAIRHALGDTFMLSADFIDGIRFRLAGTRVCALFGREIKGEGFNLLWSEESRAQIADLIIAVVNEASSNRKRRRNQTGTAAAARP
ncbi:MAG: PAS domain-containing protein [Pseudolabrys sp.]